MFVKLKNKTHIALILIVLLTVISLLLFNQRKQEKFTNDDVNFDFELAEEVEGAKLTEADTEVMIVDIKGEVNEPGIYEVKADMRVNDVITLAKGLTENADQNQLNLAQKVADEMIIQVPSTSNDPTNRNSNFVAMNESKIKLNQATIDDLVTLTGIGPSKAEAIIAYRDEVGMFKDVNDLLNVSGIGEKTLDAIRDEIQAP